MRYRSTRGGAEPVDFAGALLGGLAPDGGLYVPETIPELPAGWEGGYVASVELALRLYGARGLDEVVAESASDFDHPDVAPLRAVGDLLVYELFWGPTLSFKDHALGVVGRMLGRMVDEGTVLGATSGDTGSAAISALSHAPGLEVVILFPDGKVSELQRRQMTTVGADNVTVLAVKGSFDDCQRMVKSAFASKPGLLAVNSINWGRIAAQVGYYLYLASSIGQPFDVAVPTGNFGNAYSAWLAREMGAPIGTIVVANNANKGLASRVSGEYRATPGVVPTLAPAMDIAVPSNLERLEGDPSQELSGSWSDDAEILEIIGRVSDTSGYVLDPHSATAWSGAERHRGERPMVVVATAHPAKFPEAVGEATGSIPEAPPALARLGELEERVEVIGASDDELEAYLD